MPRRDCFSLWRERRKAVRLWGICLPGTDHCWQYGIHSKCKWEGFRSVLVRWHTPTAEHSPLTATHTRLLQNRRVADCHDTAVTCITHKLCAEEVQNCWNILKLTCIPQHQTSWPTHTHTCRYFHWKRMFFNKQKKRATTQTRFKTQYSTVIDFTVRTSYSKLLPLLPLSEFQHN